MFRIVLQHVSPPPISFSALRLAVVLACLSLVAGGPVRAQQAHVLVGAGDIASCERQGDEETAKLLDRIPGTIFTTGDNAYDRGTMQEFTACFGPSWGRHKARIRPVPGNHDYLTRGAVGYFAYFGAAAGEPGKGYYSYDVGDWHVVALNSNCAAVGGCGPGSPQGRWLAADLATHPRLCTIAYWHHPRFSSGPHGDHASVAPFWLILYAAGADVVVNGHDHLYERFQPQTPAAERDGVRGIQQFTVGTGGRSLYRVRTIQPHSAVRHATVFGVLKLTLWPDRYEWQFIAVGQREVKDAGSRGCR